MTRIIIEPITRTSTQEPEMMQLVRWVHIAPPVGCSLALYSRVGQRGINPQNEIMTAPRLRRAGPAG